MKICENGIVRDMTAEEVVLYTDTSTDIPYSERVVSRIRERYSVDDELAILRQRDTKQDEFYAYFQYAEQVKAEERGTD